MQAGDLSKDPVEPVEHLQDTLNGLLGLEWMKIGDFRRSDQVLVDLRAVLHGAGALADVDVEVRAEGFLREADVVPQHLGL